MLNTQYAPVILNFLRPPFTTPIAILYIRIKIEIIYK
jgi:hypothetical protein